MNASSSASPWAPSSSCRRRWPTCTPSLNAARAYSYAIGRACDAGHCSRQDAAAAILFGAEHATQNCLQAIQALGGNGYINDYAAGRLLRDAKLYEIGAGTQEIRRMLIGREIYEATA